MDLSTVFSNILLENPIVVASSPLTESVSAIEKCFEFGAGAVITKSCSSFNSTTTGYRRCYLDKKGWWASSTFDREIQNVKVAKDILKEVIKKIDSPIFGSVTEQTLNLSDWLSSCKDIEDSGVSGIQLDLFYLENLLAEDNFGEKFIELISSLQNSINIPIFPKLNINLPSLYMVNLLTKSGIKYVSLLDSVSLPPPIDINNMGKCNLENIAYPHKASLFGKWQLPLTIKYTYEMVNSGFITCSGGGIQSGDDIIELIMLGASATQIATEFIFNGYSRIQSLLNEVKSYLTSNNIDNLHKIRGCALPNFNKSTEMRFQSKKLFYHEAKCVKCKKCTKQVFCNALSFQDNEVKINHDKCESCSLCVNICKHDALCFYD